MNVKKKMDRTSSEDRKEGAQRISASMRRHRYHGMRNGNILAGYASRHHASREKGNQITMEQDDWEVDIMTMRAFGIDRCSNAQSEHTVFARPVLTVRMFDNC